MPTSDPCWVSTLRFIVEPAGHAEVHDDRLAPFVNHDVGGLEVAVHDPLGVHFLSASAILRTTLATSRSGCTFFAEVGRERFAATYPWRLARPCLFRDVEDRANVRMAERGGSSAFRDAGARRFAGHVAVHPWYFQHDLAIELRVVHEKDAPHAARTQNLLDPVAAEHLADGRRLGRLRNRQIPLPRSWNRTPLRRHYRLRDPSADGTGRETTKGSQRPWLAAGILGPFDLRRTVTAWEELPGGWPNWTAWGVFIFI